ncbi:hypothetical protein JB92DRAFT_557978 [Gautieria morchelliformis]|nr:hypothetical protein JB92DRAFT_557978 [Gautieria morchelliformis]
MSAEDISSYASKLVSTTAEVDKFIERARGEFGDNWRQDDDFLEKFFPVRPSWEPHIEATQKRNYNARTARWKQIPKNPKAASKLYTPLRMLMNELLVAEEESRQQLSAPGMASGPKTGRHKSAYLYELLLLETHVRRVLATHSKKKKVKDIQTRRGHAPVSPPLFLAGAGAKVLGVWWTFIKPIFQGGISPIEIILDSEDFLAARHRLLAHMTHMMSTQTHRRFANGLILTQTICVVYMFDHSGAVESAPFNYHQYPAQFCAIIFRLGSDHGEHIGFDQSIFPHDKGIVVRTVSGERPRKEVLYAIREKLFCYSNLVGRGTIVLRTVKVGSPNAQEDGPDAQEDGPDAQFIVKDAWIRREELAGRESEGSLLRHAQAQGVVQGVAQLEHFEEITRSDDPNDLDTVLRNRQIDEPTAEDLKLERVHTRIVLKTFGKTIDQFATRRDLLLAFHDAVLAHQQLYEVAGILHRDISIGNILINPGGVKGNRGILIDFDHAIRVGDTSPYSTKARIGTWRYMSGRVLEGKVPHTYLDDLESFYYVLCWILMVHTAPRVQRTPPSIASYWDKSMSHAIKLGQIASYAFDLPLEPWFGSCFQVLASRLHNFFHIRRPSMGDLAPPVDPNKDYDEYLGYIRQCILDMNAEDAAATRAATRHSTSPDGSEHSTSSTRRHPTSHSDGSDHSSRQMN